MAPPVSFTKATLSYPIYSACFDPYNRGYLVVGGGGGEGRSGVGNKLTLLDTSSRSTLDVAAEIELSRDEDSVTSLAALASRDGLVTLAGLNSSEADQKAGKNEHLRAFGILYPKRKRASGKEGKEGKEDKDVKDEKDDASAEGGMALLGKSSLFKPATGPKPETYQRLLRLSPPKKRESGSRRIGAIATGLAKNSEIIVFDATKTPPKEADIIIRIPLPAEAADLDIVESSENEFSIAWCTDYDVYEQTVTYDFVTKKAEFVPRGPRKVHSIPVPESTGSPKPRSKYRCVRFVTSQNLLMMSNLPEKKGADLTILHLYPTGPGMQLLYKVLPSHVKQGVGLDVCTLDSAKDGTRQVAIAVAGQDISITVYTVNYIRPTDTFTPFKEFTTLRDVHPLQMTSICFAPFHSPTRAPPSPPHVPGTPDKPPAPENLAHPGPQYIRLASVSMGNTVVVDTFSLSPLEPTQRHSRYVLLHPRDEAWSRTAWVIVLSFIVLVTAVLTQSYLSLDGSNSLSQFLPRGANHWLHQPGHVGPGVGKQWDSATSNVASSISSAIPDAVPSGARRLRDMLHLHASSLGEAASKAIVLRTPDEGSSDLSVDLHDREEYIKQDVKARHWHDLAEHEKKVWKDRLVAAGEWTEGQGEAVLKGVLFSSYAGLVGQVAGEVIRGL